MQMKSIGLALLIITAIFIAIMFSIEAVTVSNTFGWLGFSIAVGSIGYFMVCAPFGLRTHTTVFGRQQKYRHPVAEIPTKVVGLILVPVILCLVLSFGFYTYAI
ncbi:hypothetical protein O0V09_18945 [Dasania sp. GY-19]|uniref:Uncharacterized protein n=1 Tax=Dasania phycosphaerae TaxID=2950436 RepID=A0A9J6RT68_9GAMM|nr:hypothetical protein [Dasania phycosphaerae]MCZ0867277.1 hypothetical protein [Dasania phycosphaerae]